MLFTSSLANTRQIVFVFLVLALTACSSFPKAVNDLRDGKTEAAKTGFKKALRHGTYGKAAQFYLDAISINEDPTTTNWLRVNTSFCNIAESLQGIPKKKILKLRKYAASRPDIVKQQTQLRGRIKEKMLLSGSIPELLILEADTICGIGGALDTLRKVIVNKHIDPYQPVYEDEIAQNWTGPERKPVTRDSVIAQPGRSSAALAGQGVYPLDYFDAITIKERFQGEILRTNRLSWFQHKSDIFNLFEINESYCDLNNFKAQFPTDEFAEDCWLEESRDVLCQDELKPLLAFHRAQPHTGFDLSIAYHILWLSGLEGATDDLTPDEMVHVLDVVAMLNLLNSLNNCVLPGDVTQVTESIAKFARGYRHHHLVFKLAQALAQYLIDNDEAVEAQASLRKLQPLYPDQKVCPIPLNFQEGKQAWFERMLEVVDIMINAPKEYALVPVDTWNTESNDEHNLVSYGSLGEVYFARTNHLARTSVIMRSLRGEDGKWTAPQPVKSLSLGYGTVPISMSADGLSIILRRGETALVSYRQHPKKPWLAPSPEPTLKTSTGSIWESPDGQYRLMEYFSSDVFTDVLPDVNLAASKQQADYRFGKASPVDEGLVNLEYFDEETPILALNGRLLLFTSDRSGGLGKKDLYSAILDVPNDFSTLQTPKNLSYPVNSINDDSGITYFSEYTGLGFVHRSPGCASSQDIYQFQLGPDNFPADAIRLAGLVIDEDGQFIEDGFVEVIPNFNPNTFHSEPIQSDGTYQHTVGVATNVVRLRPAAPGYYAETDKTHFSDNLRPGDIVRDTFRMLSFEHIRKNFKLSKATFFNGTARFDQPKSTYPELTRLSDIMKTMGANIVIIGHTDKAGTPTENQRLSEERAAAVKAYLVDFCGIAPNQITTKGFGDQQPIAGNDTEEGKRQNRRVEIVFEMPKL